MLNKSDLQYKIRRTYRCVLIIISLIAETYSQSGWFVQYPVTSKNFLNDVCFIDTNNAIAVGDRGTILKTTDGGSSWNPQSSGTIGDLRSVSFTDISNGTIVGSDLILRTTDGGQTWIKQLSKPDTWFNGVCFADNNTGTVVGNENFGPSPAIIIRTTDGGISWVEQISGTTNWLIDVSFIDKNHGTVVGAGWDNPNREATILTTTDGGINWVRQSADTSDPSYFEMQGTLNGVCFADSLNGWVVGNNDYGHGMILIQQTEGILGLCRIIMQDILMQLILVIKIMG